MQTTAPHPTPETTCAESSPQPADAARVRGELTRLLCGAASAAELDAHADRFAAAIPELVPTFGFEQKNPHHDKDVWHHTLAVVAAAPAEPVLRWAALLHDIAKPQCFSFDAIRGCGHFYGHAQRGAQMAEEILARLQFDPAEKARIVQLVRHHDTAVRPEERPMKNFLRRMDAQGMRDLIALQKADLCGQANAYSRRPQRLAQAEEMLEELLREQARFSLRDLALNGDDLLALGCQGKEVGAALNACLNAVRDGRMPNERAALLEYSETIRESLRKG